MTDVVEASLDVTFKNPLRRLALVQVGETLLDDRVLLPIRNP